MITLTENAKIQINNLCQNENIHAITLNLKGGGCAGFEYDWGVCKSEDEIHQNDIVVDAGQGKLVVGATSLMFLLGSEIDYETTLIGSNFVITNPNAQSSCGCGISVNFNI